MMCNRLFQIHVYERDTHGIASTICAGREAEGSDLRA